MSDVRFVPCPECDGAGEWDEGPINCGGPAPVDPIYRQVKCPDCAGKGRVSLLTSLLRSIIENDPDDDAADGVSVLDVWRQQAAEILAHRSEP